MIIENDVAEDGSLKPASAFKRQRVTGADGRPLMRLGRPVYRVLRPGWQQMLTDLGTGVTNAVLAEDLDRVARDPRDIEDLIDAWPLRRARPVAVGRPHADERGQQRPARDGPHDGHDGGEVERGHLAPGDRRA